MTSFAEEQSPELRDRIFDEFNSLAVIYREPAAAFLRQGAGEGAQEAEVRPILSRVLAQGTAGSVLCLRTVPCASWQPRSVARQALRMFGWAWQGAAWADPGLVCQDEPVQSAAPGVDEGSSLLADGDYDDDDVQSAASGPLPSPALANGSGGRCSRSARPSLCCKPSPAGCRPDASQRALLACPEACVGTGAAVHAAAPAAAPAMDLLGDLLGPPASSAPAPVPEAPRPPPLQPRPQMTPGEFQSAWGSLQPACRLTQQLSPASFAAATAGNLQASAQQQDVQAAPP